MNINHKSIESILIEKGFTKVIQTERGCWVNDDGIICYFSPNSEIQNSYIVGYKESRMFFNKETELTVILKEIKSRINTKNDEYLPENTTKQMRYKSRL